MPILRHGDGQPLAAGPVRVKGGLPLVSILDACRARCDPVWIEYNPISWMQLEVFEGLGYEYLARKTHELGLARRAPLQWGLSFS